MEYLLSTSFDFVPVFWKIEFKLQANFLIWLTWQKLVLEKIHLNTLYMESNILTCDMANFYCFDVDSLRGCP